MDLSWEEKFAAIKALDDDASLRMRKPGDWYLDARMEIGGNGLLESLYGNGKSPEEAVAETWNQIEHMSSDRHVYSRNRRVRWNGFMWASIPGFEVSRASGGADRG